MNSTQDFCQWLSGQLDAIQRQDGTALDWELLSEEIEGLLGRYSEELEHWAGKIMRVLFRKDFRYGDWNRLRFCTGMLSSALEESPSLLANEAMKLEQEYRRMINLCQLDEMDLEGWPENTPWITVSALLEAAESRCCEFIAIEKLR